MNKKIVSFIIALTLPLTFLVGCKKDKDEFYMTEDTTASIGSIEYNAKTYKEAFYSTENYSDKFLQDELTSIVKEINDKEELVKLLNSYTSTNESDLDYVRRCFEKYNALKEQSINTRLESNEMYEVSSRLYKATLNATKKHYDINDFYIYYKDQLSKSNSSSSEKDFDNNIKMTAIKEYTIAIIYKSAYTDSFISNLVASIDNDTQEAVDEEDNNSSSENNNPQEVVDKEDNNSSNENTLQNNSSQDNNTDDETYPEYLELNDVIKSQIYDAGVNSAIEYIAQSSSTTPSEYCRKIYDDLENDNPLGENKEEGYKSFLDGFKSTLQNNQIEFK